MFDSTQLAIKAAKLKKQTFEVFRRWKHKTPPLLDDAFHRAHEDVFSRIDCLACGNCCRDLGPQITYRDIEKMAKYLKIKPSELTHQHLRMDEDGDYVFKSMPCPFLRADNYCSIYDERPKACREYPHTDRRKMIQILDITLKNTFVCPAVFEIVECVKEELKPIVKLPPSR